MKIKSASWFLFVLALCGSAGIVVNSFLTGSIAKTYNIYALGVTGIAFLALCLVALIDRKTLTTYTYDKNIFAGIFSLLAGVGLCIDAGYDIVTFAMPIDVKALLSIVFAIVGAIGFFVLGFSAFSGKYNVKAMPFVASMPVLWGCFKLVETFLLYTKQSIVSSQIYDIAAVICLLLFLFYNASIISRIPSKSAVKMTYVFGITGTLFAVLWVLNAIFMDGLNGNIISSFTDMTNIDAFIYMIVALYAFSILIEFSLNIGTKTGYELEDEDFSEEEKIFGKIKKKTISYSKNTDEEEKVDYSEMLKDSQPNTDEKTVNKDDLSWMNQLDGVISNEDKDK